MIPQARTVWTILIFAGALTLGCDGKNDKGDGDGGPGGVGGRGGSGRANDDDVSGSNYGKVVIQATGLALLDTPPEPESCGFSLDIYRGEGTCLTPLSVSGHAEQVSLLADVSGRGPTRLLAADDNAVADGAIWGGSSFDLASESSSLVGNNTLWDEYDGKPTYTAVSVDFAYVRYQIAVKDQYVTVLLPAYSQPFATAAQTLCGFSGEVATQARYANADLLEDMEFQRGDYLFCVKSEADAACEAGDYRWLDVDARQLVASRPTNPKRSTYLSGTPVVCQNEGGERYNFNFLLSGAYANIPSASQFKLYGDFSHGELSRQWPAASTPMDQAASTGEQGTSTGEPFVIYYHEAPGGAQTSGSELVARVDFDVTNSLFIEGLRADDVEDSPLEMVLGAFQIKSQWVFDQKFAGGVEGGSASHYAGMNATVGVTLSGGTKPPKPAEQL